MATQRPQQSSIAIIVIAAAVVTAGAAVAYQYPGVVAIWAGILIAAWMEPPSILTGPKINGRITPLDDREKAKQQTFQVWKNLQTGLLLPGGIIPGWPIYWSWVTALATAGVAALLPGADPWYRLANAAAAFIIVAQVSAARRAGTGSPGTRLDSHKKALGDKPALLILATIGGTIAGPIVGTVVTRAWRYAPAGMNTVPDWAWITALTILGTVLGAGLIPRKIALEHWREVVAARKDWDPRWEALKALPAPYLTDVATVGTAQMFSFTVGGDASPYVEQRRAGQAAALVGGGVRLTALTCPNELNGQPVPGTVHPNKFQIAIWPADQLPALFDPETTADARLLGVRAEWQARWTNQKLAPGPEVLSTELVGPARVDTFDAGSAGAALYWPLAPKLSPTFPEVTVMAVLPTIDQIGQRSQQTFSIVSWPGDLPDLTDPDIDDTLAELALATAIIRVCEDNRYAVPILEQVQRISEDGQPVTREVRLGFPDGPTMQDLRTGGTGEQAAAMLCSDCVINHRDGNGLMWIGALDPTTIPAATARKIDEEREEDRFRPVWTQSLKMNMHPPRIQHNLKETRSLLPDTVSVTGRPGPRKAPEDGPKVTRYAFGIPQGIDPAIYFGYEEMLKTAIFPTTYISVGGMTERGTGRPGDRIDRLIVLYHSKDPVPNTPDLLNPCPAADWILHGMVNKAFKAARLTQPEVVIGRSRCLTVPGGRKHIWQITVRLYGGNTLVDVRAVKARLAGGFGSPWLRVTASPEEGLVVLYVGAEPKSVTLAKPDKDQLVVDSLDWQQAFIDGGATGSGGMQPILTATDVMPHNDQVKILDFNLPSGLDVPTIKKALPKLKASTGNEYIEVKPGKGGASTITINASVNDPMPRRAPYDFETALASSGIPFATGVDGEPVVYDWRNSPHLLIAGMTGAGKSAALQQLIAGVILRGMELYILDPTKGAADFKFAEPWASGIATTISESAAMMKGLYAEVTRRKLLNAKYGVGSYKDLPANERPPHLVIVIDEFTSLMGTDPVSKTPFEDPDAESERLQVVAANNARMQIGSFTGKTAREARSAGVTLLLATQKLAAKMLDTIPNGGDLKDLSLDTRLPVPVSDRFPTGWALNQDLVAGDVLYSADGSQTRIVGFSEEMLRETAYEVIFSDGSRVVTGPGHVWRASSEANRNAQRMVKMTEDGVHVRDAMIAVSDVLRTTLSAGTLVSADTLSAMTNSLLPSRKAAAYAKDFRLQSYETVMTGNSVRPATTGVPARTYPVREAVAVMTAMKPAWASIEDLDPYLDGDMSLLDLVLTADSGSLTHRGSLHAALRRGGVLGDAGTRELLYDGAEFFDMLADRLRNLTGTQGGPARTADQLVTTEEIAASMTRGPSRGNNWSVRVASAIEGPDCDLPVAPYVLGAWLGDGATASGIIVSDERNTDTEGRSDSTYMLEQVTTAGYHGHVLPCDGKLIGTYGLMVPLRDLGVLMDKYIPAPYLRASAAQRLSLLRGLMDTDGTLNNNGGCVISLTNQRLADDVAELIGSLGWKVGRSTTPAWYNLSNGERKVTGTTYISTFYADRPVFALPRKIAKQRMTYTSRPRRRSILEVRPLPNVATRCIAVDHPSHLFLVENFIPTHNTNLARILLGNTTYGDRQSALRMPDYCPDLGTVIPIGRGLFEPSISGPEAIQVWYDAPSALGAFLAEHVPPVEKKFDFSPYETKQDDRRGPGVSEVSMDDVFTVEAMDEVVDLGELDLDFGDLEDLEDVPDDVAEIEPEPVPDSAELEPEPVLDVVEPLPEPIDDEPGPVPDPVPEDEPIPAPVATQGQAETAPSSPWDRPWGSAPVEPVSVSPAPVAKPQTPLKVTWPKKTHTRAPIVGSSDF